jgi:hypothetical protein
VDKTRSVHFELSAQWSPERLAKAHALRGYRDLMRGAEPARQWSLECEVYRLRADGVPESVILDILTATLERQRPHRMTSAMLARRLAPVLRTRRTVGVKP